MSIPCRIASSNPSHGKTNVNQFHNRTSGFHGYAEPGSVVEAGENADGCFSQQPRQLAGCSTSYYINTLTTDA
jgi:hypothetical protein